jgi:hypothetical protein
MKYEKPEVTAVTDAVRAIQTNQTKVTGSSEDGDKFLPISCYEDNE